MHFTIVRKSEQQPCRSGVNNIGKKTRWTRVWRGGAMPACWAPPAHTCSQEDSSLGASREGESSALWPSSNIATLATKVEKGIYDISPKNIDNSLH